MRLDATLGATHRRRGLRDVHAFETPQHKRLALSRGQRCDRRLESLHRLVGHEPAARFRQVVRNVLVGISRCIVVVARTRRPDGENPRADTAAPLPVADAVVEDAVEQRLPFFARPLAITAGEPQHGTLHDIECIVAVAYGHLRNAERPLLDFGQKPVQRSRLVQTGLLSGRRFDVGQSRDRRDFESTRAFHRRRLPAAHAALTGSFCPKTSCAATG